MESICIRSGEANQPIPIAPAKAYQLFAEGKMIEAIPLFQKEIESTLSQNIKIEGLGNYWLAQGYYHWFIPRWYAEQIQSGKIKRNPYDALSVCYAGICDTTNMEILKIVKDGVSWYRSIKRKSQRSYQILQGYANLLNNSSSYDEAIRVYKKVIGLKP